MAEGVTQAAILLREWMDSRRFTQQDVALVMGVTQFAVSLWLSGKRTPEPLHRAKLERYTNGFVPVMLWFSEEELAELKTVLPYDWS